MTKAKAFRPSLAKRYAADLQRAEQRLALLEESHERMRQTTTDASSATGTSSPGCSPWARPPVASELTEWLQSLPADAMVGVDEGGLAFVCVADSEAYIEVGGLDADEVTP